jgi:hypothetical protein
MGDGIQCARHQWEMLNENAEENGDEQILIEAGDVSIFLLSKIFNDKEC